MRPWGAAAAKIDVFFPCSTLQLLMRSLVIAGLSIALCMPRVRPNFSYLILR